MLERFCTLTPQLVNKLFTSTIRTHPIFLERAQAIFAARFSFTHSSHKYSTAYEQEGLWNFSLQR